MTKQLQWDQPSQKQEPGSTAPPVSKPEPLRFTDLNLKLQLGSLLVNVLYITYEHPVPGWHYTSHCHSTYELHMVPSGRGRLRVARQDLRLGPGSLYLTGPGIYHEQWADELEPMSEYCINFELKQLGRPGRSPDTFIPSEIAEIESALKDTDFWCGSDLHGTTWLCSRLVSELESRQLGCYTVVQSLLSQIIVYAVRSFTGLQPSSTRLPRKQADDIRRHTVDDYFYDPAAPLTPQDLAARVGVSVRQLERILRQYYGLTFRGKLQATRMELARELLRGGTLPIHRIAEQLGFASASYFSRQFRVLYGRSPQQYRETGREEG